MSVTLDCYALPSGEGVEFLLAGDSGPSFVTALASLPTLTVNGTDRPLLMSDLFWHATIPAMPTIRLYFDVDNGAPRLLSSDAITFSAAAGAITCQAGPSPAVSGRAAINRVGGVLYPDLPTTATMKVGYNCPQANDQVGSPYNNRYRQSQLANDFVEETGALTQPSYQFFNWIANTPNNEPGKFWPALENRGWVLAWDGPDTAGMEQHYGTVTEDVSRRAITGTTDNRRYYTTGGDGSAFGADLYMTFASGMLGGSPRAAGSGYKYNVTNLRLLADDVDVDTYPTFNASHLSRVSPMQSIRFLDNVFAVAGNGTDFSDYTRPYSVPSRFLPIRVVTATIASIRQYVYDAGDPWPRDFPSIPGTGGIALRITTASAHGLSDYQWIALDCPGAAATLDDASTLDLSAQRGFIYLISATEVVFYGSGGQGRKMVNTLAGPGKLTMSIQGIVPIAEIVEMCNAAHCDLYWNTTFSNTDACLASVADYVARNLDPGLKFRVAISNEVWNFGAAGYTLAPFVVASTLSWLYHGAGDPNEPQQYTIAQSHHVWEDVMIPAWVAAGRDRADFRRVAESQHGNPAQVTGTIGLQFSGNGWTFDELSTGPYWRNTVAYQRAFAYETEFTTTIGRMTVGQHLDSFESYSVWGGYELEFPRHATELVNHGYVDPVDMIAYEAGEDDLFLPAGTGTPNAHICHAMSRHPRWWGIGLNRLRTYQDSDGVPGHGCTLIHKYILAYIDQGNGTPWSAYQGPGQLPYAPGDPDQDAIQINTPDDLGGSPPAVRSVMGGYWQHWGAMAGGAPPAPDFAVSVSGSGTLTQGGSTTRTVTLRPLNGLAATVDLSATGLPTGVTAGSFSPASLTPGGAVVSTLTLNASSSATLGPAPFSVVGSDAADSLTRSGPASVTVLAPSDPDFSIAVAGPVTLAQGGTVDVIVTLDPLNGFAGTAALSATGLPRGVSVAAFSPPSLTGGGTMASTLTLAASNSATTGAAMPSVEADDPADSLTHSASFALTVTASGPPAPPAGSGRSPLLRRLAGR